MNSFSYLYINFFFLFLISYIFFSQIIKRKNNFLPKIFLKKKSDYNMHKHRVVHNGGLIVIFGLLITLVINFFFFKYEIIESFENVNKPYVLILAVIFLTIISIIDFRITLHPTIRLIFQFLIVFSSLALINFPLFDVNIIPLKLQYLLVVIFWIYIINVTNFIDGTDGMLAVNILSLLICIIILILNSSYYNNALFFISTNLIPILLAFLIFNWPSAKIFMGDCGSIPLGYLIGYSLLNLVSEGQYFICSIIFLYPLLDITINLFRKISKKIVPWARMFDYSFLQPVLKGKKKHLFVLNIILITITVNCISIILTIKYNLNNIIIFLFILILNLGVIKYFDEFRNIKKS